MPSTTPEAGTASDSGIEGVGSISGTTADVDCPPGGQFMIKFDTPNNWGAEHHGYGIYSEVIDSTPGEGYCRAGKIQYELDAGRGVTFVWPGIGKAGHTYYIAQWMDYAKDNTCHVNTEGPPLFGHGLSAQWLFPIPGTCNRLPKVLNCGVPGCTIESSCVYTGKLTGDFTWNFTSSPAPNRAACCQFYPMGKLTIPANPSR